MESNYRYYLDKSSRKFLCPQCNKKTFVRFIDTEINDYLPYEFGRCDREENCNYYLNPYAEKYQQDQFIPTYKPQRKAPTPKKEIIYFDFNTFKKTLNAEGYKKNTFIQNLINSIPKDEVSKVIELYRLGTTSAGAITFPFIDIVGNFRAIQVKQFDKDNHTTNTNWLHAIIAKNLNVLPKWLEEYQKQDLKVSCLFGEHLLKLYPDNPIALVEAPKTAIYGTLYFGQPKTPKDFIWLAVYNKSSFKLEKIKVLEGRTVFVFPDLSKDGSTFNEWKTKAGEFQKKLKGTKVIFSDLLERLASEKDRQEGNDLADILIQYNWKDFRAKSDASDASDTTNKTYSKVERIVFGINYFKEEDLKELSSRMFQEKDNLTYNEAIQVLFNLEGLKDNDADDLLDVLSIRKIISYNFDKWVFTKNE